MDFKSLELPEIMEVHIADPMGEKLYSDDEMKKPVIIGLHLPQSKAMRVYDNKIHNKTLKLSEIGDLLFGSLARLNSLT